MIVLCKKDFYDKDYFFDGKYYWVVSYGRKLYKIIPKPKFIKNKYYSAETYPTYSGVKDWYLVKSNSEYHMFTIDFANFFYTEIEILQKNRKQKLKIIENENKKWLCE